MRETRKPLRIERRVRKIGFLGRGMALSLGEQSDFLYRIGMKLGDQSISTDRRILEKYSVDVHTVPTHFEGFFSRKPQAVVYARSAEDVASVLEICSDEQMHVVIRGGGTAGLGGANSTGGVVLDLSQMDGIESIDKENDEVVVKAGCKWSNLLEFLNQEGYEPYEFPLSGDLSTVGGWISTGGLGWGSVDVTGFQKTIVAMKVAIPSGLLIDASKEGLRYSIKSFKGTEGQMGVVTTVRLKIRRITGEKHTVFCLTGKLVSLAILASKMLTQADLIAGMTILGPGLCELVSIGGIKEETFIIDIGDRKDSHLESTLFRLAKEIDPSVKIVKEDLIPRNMMIGGRLITRGIELLGEVIVSPDCAHQLITSVVKRLSGKAEVSYFVHIVSSQRCVVFFFAITESSCRGVLRRNLRETYRIVAQAISLGGIPYGVGIWNTPFSRMILGSDYEALRQVKIETDRFGLINSGRFFGLKSGWGIPVPGFLLKGALRFG